MEDKLLEMCKKTLKIQNDFSEVECTYKGECNNCPFSRNTDGREVSCTDLRKDEVIELAQNYIKEHEKTVNTIEKIEEKIKLKELQEIKKDNIIPTYYHKGSYDVIQFCNDNEIEFTTGNIIKYITRYKGKNGIEDLKKAKEYLRRLQGTEYDISLADLVHFSLENDLNYTQGKIIELVLGDELTKAGNVLNDLIEKEEKKIREIEETYQTEGMAD